MKHLVYFIVMMVLAAPVQCQDTTSGNTYRLGSLKLQVISACYQPCKDSISWLNVHENESTSVMAAEEFLTGYGGTLVKLKHSGERYISFYLGKSRFIIDPNRIFTAKGIQATLRKLGPYTPDAGKKVTAFSSHLLNKYVHGKKLVIALHNNTDQNYSIRSYLPGGDEAVNAAEVHINPAMDEDDFIVTTEDSIFRQVKAKNINVILQDNKKVTDDGSLSVYAAKKNIPYINIEAQEGHRKEQLEMMEAIKDILDQYRGRKKETNF